MTRAAAITNTSAGTNKIWTGTAHIKPNARTSPHHYGALESIIYEVRVIARMCWGNRLEYTAVVEAGDFIYVPPFVPHQELNAISDELLMCVLVRSDQDPIVVSVDI